MSIVLERLVKRYGDAPIVQELSLEIPEREFFVLLGPSGSGKSTVLRMIAGLVEVDQGRISLGGRDVTRMAPQRRGIGMVFQHYALFRHMSAAENIEFPLRIRKTQSAERRRRRDELLELVGLAGLGSRMPSQLSGGQQQRVALARALAHKPDVLLLDEPFGALDAKIRSELRGTLRAIQRELGVTTIFVTHDQDEAFELADRLGIMHLGRLLEIGPPHELYLRPQTEFVATFLGAANLMVGECVPEGVRLGSISFPLGTAMASEGGARRVQVLFRPEDVAVTDSEESLTLPPLGKAVIEESSFAGSFERLRLRLPRLAGVRPISPAAPFGSEHILVEATRSQHLARQHPLRAGDSAWVGVRRLHALPHPGLRILVSADGSGRSEAGLNLGAGMARLAQARVTMLVHGDHGDHDHQGGDTAAMKQARERIGEGLTSLEQRSSSQSHPEAIATETRRHSYDLVVTSTPRSGLVEFVGQILLAGNHNLLLVPGPAEVPRKVLICVAVGEPSKENVLFAGRLVRHFRASVTMLTVLPHDATDGGRDRAERFLVAAGKSLGMMGVTSSRRIRMGEALAEILGEMREGGHELVVMGAPLRAGVGKESLSGLLADLMDAGLGRPLLITRARQTGIAT